MLVEVEAKKGFQDIVEIHYRDSKNATSIIKYVKVEYMWKPQVCAECSVFGHNCQKKSGTVNMEEAKKIGNLEGVKSNTQKQSAADRMLNDGGKGVSEGESTNIASKGG